MRVITIRQLGGDVDAAGLMTRSMLDKQLAAYSCIAAALALVLLLGAWFAYYDVRQFTAASLRSEIARLRSHAERSAGHIENQLTEEGPEKGLGHVARSSWLLRYWERHLPRAPERLYSAVVDKDGRVLAHSRADREGLALSADWRGMVLTDVGEGVQETDEAALSGGAEAVDVSIPIFAGGQEVGAYHSGLSAVWLRKTLSDGMRQRSAWWVGVVSAIAAIVLLSSVSLYRITRRTTRLENELELASARRATEVNELVLGVAHEIRNPLNAIRLNLHTIEQVLEKKASLPEDEVAAMLSDCAQEIERLEDLMRELLGFARTDPQDLDRVELIAETHATLKFLKQKLDQAAVRISIAAPESPSVVHMNRGRLRQVILNLITNASDAAGSGGHVEVEIRRQRDRVQLTITDDGPGVSPQDHERIFAPFFSTKADGLGLGLALVRKRVEEAGGQVSCESNPTGHGSRFRLWLPLAKTA